MHHTIQGHAALLLSGLLLASIAGCAYGGGGDGVDSGIVIRDSGRPPGIDSGPLPGFDGGRRDGGTFPGVDSGTPADSGGGGTCPETPCRLIPPQCGCPAGQGCYLGSGATRMCGTPGPETEGQACSGATACQAGLLCAGSGGGPSFCSRFCGSDADCVGGAGSLCLLELNDGSGGTIPSVRLCTIHCSLTSTTSPCPTGLGCGLYQESAGAMRLFTGCRPVGTGSAGSSCLTNDDCATGHFCADPTGSGFDECVRYCTYPAGSECSSFEACNAFSEPAVVGGVEYGFCY